MEVIATDRKDEAFLSLSETARMLGVSERTIHRWIHDGRLPVYKPGRAYRFRLSEIEAFLEERRGVPFAEALMQMPPDEFDERRRAAIAGEIDDVEFREALFRGYNAAGRTLKGLQQSDASAEDLEQAKEDHDEAKKRWLVTVVDDAETTIALDTKRVAASVERRDTRDLPLDEAYEQIQGRLGVPV